MFRRAGNPVSVSTSLAVLVTWWRRSPTGGSLTQCGIDDANVGNRARRRRSRRTRRRAGVHGPEPAGSAGRCPPDSLTAPVISDTGSLKGPRQPIFFRHDIHAGQFKIQCQYCHYSVNVSPEPGIRAP